MAAKKSSQNSKMPISIIILLVFLGIGILLGLSSLITNGINGYFGLLFLGLFNVACSIALFVGIIGAKKWARPWGIGYFILSFVLTVFFMLQLAGSPQYLAQINPDGLLDDAAVQVAAFVGVVIGLGVNFIATVIFIILLAINKKYFTK